MANIHNQHTVLEEVSDYLEAHDFVRADKDITGTAFINGNKAIVLYKDQVSFRVCDKDEFHQYAMCDGTSILDFVGWVNLLDAFKMISIQQSINEVRKHLKKSIDLKIVQPAPVNMVQMVENIFSNVKSMLVIAVASLLLFTSCNTVRQTQLQHGNVVIENGHIYFDATEAYKQIPKDTVLVGFRVRNIAAKKSK